MAVRVWLDLPRDARWVPSVREVAGSLLQTAGTPDADVADVQLALTEACANVVRHAVGTDSYSVGLAIDPAGCEVEIVDRGPGFEEDAAGDSADYAESGRGLDLMRALVDDLEVRTDPGTTRLVLRKRSSAGPDPPPVVATGEADASQRIRRSRPFRPGELDPAWAGPHDEEGSARVLSGRVGAGSAGDVRPRQPRAVETDPSA